MENLQTDSHQDREHPFERVSVYRKDDYTLVAKGGDMYWFVPSDRLSELAMIEPATYVNVLLHDPDFEVKTGEFVLLNVYGIARGEKQSAVTQNIQILLTREDCANVFQNTKPNALVDVDIFLSSIAKLVTIPARMTALREKTVYMYPGVPYAVPGMIPRIMAIDIPIPVERSQYVPENLCKGRLFVLLAGLALNLTRSSSPSALKMQEMHAGAESDIFPGLVLSLVGLYIMYSSLRGVLSKKADEVRIQAHNIRFTLKDIAIGIRGFRKRDFRQLTAEELSRFMNTEERRDILHTRVQMRRPHRLLLFHPQKGQVESCYDLLEI